MLAPSLELVHNLALLVAISVVSGFIRQARLSRAWAAVAQGLLFGGAAVIAMAQPLDMGGGLFFDGRSVVLGLSGLFFGPLAAVCAMLPAIAFRLAVGGSGLALGLLVIFEATLLGVLLGHRRRPGRGMGALLVLGFAVHILMALLILALLRERAWVTLHQVGLPVLVIYPAATLLAGRVLLHQEREAQTRQALRDSEGQLRALLAAIPDLLFINHRDGTFLSAQNGENRHYHVPPEQFLGRKVTEVMPEPLGARILAAYDRALASRTLQHLEYDLMVNGQAQHYDARILPYGEDTVLSMVRDVTEQRRMQAQFVQAQKLESLGSLAGGVAHDINNVLGAILGLSSTQELLQPPGAGRQAFSIITKAAERGADMVKRLLSFARVRPAEERDLDLNAVLLEVVGLLERTTLAKVTLVQDFDPQLGMLRGDPGALVHVFMNLCVNAVDAMPEGGTLTLRTRMAGPSLVEAEVMDTGVGMPPEVLERAMDPFFTTKEQGKGTGLGLAMAYSTVKAHHGSLVLVSQPGEGTSATLRFPARAGDGREPAAAAAAPVPVAEGGLKVLVVDDAPRVRDSTCQMLEALGHQVDCAATGEKALAATCGRPDLVVLDMNMPGWGGAGTLPRLRERWPEVPVVLATGRADQAALDLVKAHAGVRLLSKPFRFRDLQAALEVVEPSRATP